MKEPSPEEDTRALVMTAYEMADNARRQAASRCDGLDRAVGRDRVGARLVATIISAPPRTGLAPLCDRLPACHAKAVLRQADVQ
jgi:hypothetical protein